MRPATSADRVLAGARLASSAILKVEARVSSSNVMISVVCGDVLRYSADVLALKYAQNLYGVDESVVGLLRRRGVDVAANLPQIGQYLLVNSSGAISARKVLFVGVAPLGRFQYAEIRQFARDVLANLQTAVPDAQQVAMTLHGRGFGLDEFESFKAELAGLLDALNAGLRPGRLKSISIVERDEQTAARLTLLLSAILPSGQVVTSGISRKRSTPLIEPEALRNVGAESRDKPHIFVAMPFAPDFDDRFHYGIRNAVNAAGYLCERADLASFTGDVIAWVRERIGQASLVIADLSTANPNVYLEVGYAWGRDVRTVLVVSSASELRFDVQGQRCLVFTSIRHLEELLTKELKALGDVVEG